MSRPTVCPPKIFYHIIKLPLPHHPPRFWRFSLAISPFSLHFFLVSLAINTASIPDSISRSISFYEPITFFLYPVFIFFLDAYQNTHVHRGRIGYDYKTLYNAWYYVAVSFHWPDGMVFKNHDVENVKIVYMNLISCLQMGHRVTEIEKHWQSQSLHEANQRHHRRPLTMCNKDIENCRREQRERMEKSFVSI